MKKIIITSGGTREYIDDVRVLTNISTGKLGAIITETFCETDVNLLAPELEKEEIHIYYVYTKGSVIPIIENNSKITLVEVKDTNDLISKLSKLVPECDIIIHSMAVSDFSFNNEKNIKLKSNSKKDFIKYLKKNIKKNPKVISYIKYWNPKIELVGFKFEVGLKHKELIKIAKKSLKSNSADYVVCNDKKEMQKENEHIAYIVHKKFGKLKCVGKKDIALKLKEALKL